MTVSADALNVQNGVLNNNSIGTIVLNGGELTTNITGGTINSESDNIVVGSINAETLNLTDGVLNMIGTLNVVKTKAIGGDLNFINYEPNPANLGELTLGQEDMIVDTGIDLYANIVDEKINQIKVTSLVNENNNKIDLELNMPSRVDTILTNPNITLNPIAIEEGELRTQLAGVILHESQNTAGIWYIQDT